MWDLLTQDEKNNILIKILVKLCKIDGKIQEQEYSYIIYVANVLNIKIDIIKEYLINDDELNEVLPSEEIERAKVLYHLLFAINADNIISPEEEEMVYKLAFKLGFHDEMTKDFVELMKTYNLNDLPDQSMVKILRKYNN
jgi:hypothetical protein